MPNAMQSRRYLWYRMKIYCECKEREAFTMNTKMNTKDAIRTACSTVTKQLAYNAAKKAVCAVALTSLSPAVGTVLVNVVPTVIGYGASHLSDLAISKLFDD